MKKKIKKRLLSLTLAVLLITALAIPASASSTVQTRTYNGCTYALAAECQYASFYSLMEYQSSDTGTYADYILQTSITYYQDTTGEDFFVDTIYSVATYRVSTVSDSIVGTLDHIECNYYINGRPAGGKVTVRAS